MKLRRNEMILRKNQIISPKNFAISSVEIFKYFGGNQKVSEGDMSALLSVYLSTVGSSAGRCFLRAGRRLFCP